MRCAARFSAAASSYELQNPDVELGPKLELVRWLAHHMHDRGETLRAGQFVLSGSLFPPYSPVGTQTVTFEIEGTGSVTLSCEA